MKVSDRSKKNREWVWKRNRTQAKKREKHELRGTGECQIEREDLTSERERSQKRDIRCMIYRKRAILSNSSFYIL